MRVPADFWRASTRDYLNVIDQARKASVTRAHAAWTRSCLAARFDLPRKMMMQTDGWNDRINSFLDPDISWLIQRVLLPERLKPLPLQTIRDIRSDSEDFASAAAIVGVPLQVTLVYRTARQRYAATQSFLNRFSHRDCPIWKTVEEDELKQAQLPVVRIALSSKVIVHMVTDERLRPTDLVFWAPYHWFGTNTRCEQLIHRRLWALVK